MAVTDVELIDRLVARRRRIHAAEAAEAADLLEYVDRARSAGEGLGGVTEGRREEQAALHELALARHVSVAAVTTAVSRARTLRSSLPHVWSAWHAGRFGEHAARLIDDAATRLVDPASLVRLDDEVVEVAAERTPAQLAAWLRRFVERVETDGARRRHEIAMAQRRVRVRPVGDGMALVTALMSVLDAAAIDTRLDHEARSLPSADPRTLDQARADVLRDLLLGPADAHAGPHLVVGVTVPLPSLMGFSDAPGELADRSASVPAHVVREAVRQPGTLLYRLLTDERGGLLDATWLGRFAPAQLAQVLRFRDATSVFPTSQVPAHRCDVDHTVPFDRLDPASGPTTARNLGALHRRAHRLKTEGRLRLRQPEPGSFEWITRTGHVYRRDPEPLPVARWDDLPWPGGATPDPLADCWDEMVRDAVA